MTTYYSDPDHYAAWCDGVDCYPHTRTNPYATAAMRDAWDKGWDHALNAKLEHILVNSANALAHTLAVD